MFAVMFESHPQPGRRDTYLEWATRLGTDLRKIPGFVDDHYYRSLSREGWLLSLSTWEDEKALVSWRTHPTHQLAQAKGRDEFFIDYTLRTGQLTRDTELPEGHVLGEQRLDETVAGAGNTAVLVDRTQPTHALDPHDAVEMTSHLGLDLDAAGLTDWDVYEAVLTPGHVLMRTVWHDYAAAEAFETTAAFPDGSRLRRIRIIRFYSMYNRREAPQYYPDRPT
ncbi:antibiotic biosynthesis monooxygenase [Pseudonocardia sp. MH-G8]|uniref:antibiotic biosynthesis monooxygenase family protein n=1 Tax=Pseudonocardia sp. MH-G8 TaxID=1854588 RepID=UPI000B9FF209|nr:antibiotic biosynthesis monooxygenase [Pseudonocardia sp. MH-G8]OZM78003.1 antibiotic biosynthesis monooxygenase [Pseudonocardia sp. MH-G8]